ncbi:MAG: thioesterase family protein [Candidatus Hydrothermales bacterium]
MFEHKIHVRYAETDQMGVVYYANFFVYFEAARTSFMRENGYPYSKLEKEGFFLPVVEAYCEYKSPAHYDEELTVRLFVKELKNTSFKIQYDIYREDKLIATGYTRHVLTDKNLKPVRIPNKIREIFEKHLIK